MSRARALLREHVSPAEVARRTGAPYYAVRAERDLLCGGQERDAEAGLAVSVKEEVARLLHSGLSRAEVARRLEVSRSTVSYHAKRLGAVVDDRPARRYDWSAVQAHYDAGNSVRQCMERFGFSSASWTGAVRRGALVARPLTKPIDELLRGARNRTHMKERLLKAGLLRLSCSECGIASWRGRRLALELHHINGDGKDNRLENLTLLCPNCHSQTDSWGGRNSSRTPLRA